jgi:transposase
VTYRHALTDAQWDMIRSAIPSRRGPKPTLEDRKFIDAVLYRATTGIPWRDLPDRFGSWKTVFNRFSNWSLRGHWEAIFATMKLAMDDEGVILDATVVRAHQDSAGGKGGSSTTLWVIQEVDSPQKSTRSSTREGVRSTSKSRQVSNTKRASRKTSSQTTPGAKR